MYKSKTVQSLAINLILSTKYRDGFFAKLNEVLRQENDSVIKEFFAHAMRVEVDSTAYFNNTKSIIKALWLTSSDIRIEMCKFILYQTAIGKLTKSIDLYRAITDKELKEAKIDFLDILKIHVDNLKQFPANNNVKDCIKDMFAQIDENHIVFLKYAEIQEVIDEAIKDLERA